MSSTVDDVTVTEERSLVGTFLDDNYDASSTASAVAALANTWAALVNPLDPDEIAGTGPSVYRVGGDPSSTYTGTGATLDSIPSA